MVLFQRAKIKRDLSAVVFAEAEAKSVSKLSKTESVNVCFCVGLPTHLLRIQRAFQSNSVSAYKEKNRETLIESSPR